jgi:hypothetical protein
VPWRCSSVAERPTHDREAGGSFPPSATGAYPLWLITSGKGKGACGFNPRRPYGLLAQQRRAAGFYPVGSGFESLAAHRAPVVQRTERLPSKQREAGSTPARRTSRSWSCRLAVQAACPSSRKARVRIPPGPPHQICVTWILTSDRSLQRTGQQEAVGAASCTRLHRLRVRIGGFHPPEQGSNPCGATWAPGFILVSFDARSSNGRMPGS